MLELLGARTDLTDVYSSTAPFAQASPFIFGERPPDTFQVPIIRKSGLPRAIHPSRAKHFDLERRSVQSLRRPEQQLAKAPRPYTTKMAVLLTIFKLWPHGYDDKKLCHIMRKNVPELTKKRVYGFTEANMASAKLELKRINRVWYKYAKGRIKAEAVRIPLLFSMLEHDQLKYLSRDRPISLKGLNDTFSDMLDEVAAWSKENQQIIYEEQRVKTRIRSPSRSLRGVPAQESMYSARGLSPVHRFPDSGGYFMNLDPSQNIPHPFGNQSLKSSESRRLEIGTREEVQPSTHRNHCLMVSQSEAFVQNMELNQHFLMGHYQHVEDAKTKLQYQIQDTATFEPYRRLSSFVASSEDTKNLSVSNDFSTDEQTRQHHSEEERKCYDSLLMQPPLIKHRASPPI